MNAPETARPVLPDCFRCRHLWITHERSLPYGCRAFALRSRRLPSALVLETSGVPCTAFEPKPAPPGPRRDP